jgi:hypothetical protein
MTPLRLPRWIALLALPVLVAALLLMHGLDAPAGASGGHGESAEASPHPPGAEAPAAGQEAQACPTCVTGHVMVACLAVVATIAALHVVVRAAALPLVASVDAASRRVLAAGQLLRPPDPAWIRLAVMQC